MSWDPERERRAIVAHLRRCRFCRALTRYGDRRRDAGVRVAAERLARDHAVADAERAAFARPSARDPAPAQTRRSSMRMAILGGDRDA
jgi:hypothetical protein